MAFDWRTEIRDEKSGKILKHQPYRYHVSREHGDALERDGKFYDGDGVELPITEWPPKKAAAAPVISPVATNLPRK